MFKTADLYDEHMDDIQVCEPIFSDFGGYDVFCGKITTVKCFEDNSRIKELATTPGEGRVLVVDGGGSKRCALLGDLIAEDFVNNGWTGVIIYGCVRDSADLADMDIGVKALACIPRKSTRRGEGQADLSIRFAGVTFEPGDWVYADHDGIIVSREELDLPELD